MIAGVVAGRSGQLLLIAGVVCVGVAIYRVVADQAGERSGAPMAAPMAAKIEDATVREKEPATRIVPRRSEELGEGVPEQATRPAEAQTTPAAAPPSSFIRGWLVGPDGQPLKSHRIRATERARGSGRRSSHTTELECDADGKFRLKLEEPFDPAAFGAKRTVQFEARSYESRSELLATTLDLTRVLPEGDTDVGKLVLTLAPVIVAGVVVDPIGQPVAGASAVVFSEASPEARVESGMMTDKQGKATILVFSGGIHLRVEAEGYRTARLPGCRRIRA